MFLQRARCVEGRERETTRDEIWSVVRVQLLDCFFFLFWKMGRGLVLVIINVLRGEELWHKIQLAVEV